MREETELAAANERVELARQELETAEAARRRASMALEAARMKNAPPVDRSQQQLASGEPVPVDRSHVETKGNGQQKDYVVLTPAERAKGFVRPVRDAYRHVGLDICGSNLGPWNHGDSFVATVCGGLKGHSGEHGHDGKHRVFVATQPQLDRLQETGRFKGCDAVTTMSQSIAETYARDPAFYSGTFCTTCREHFPVGERGEFTWYENDGREGQRVGT